MSTARRAAHWLTWLLVSGLLLAACGLRQRQTRAAPTATPFVVATALAGATQAPAATAAEPTVAPTAGEPTATIVPTDPALGPLSFVPGRNDYTLTVDDTPRAFLVYVPPGYNADTPTPVVFMFHGSNQGGPLMYANTGWAAKADAENFLVVYPTSWRYPLVGENGLHEKWNSFSLYTQVVPGTALQDDVHFVQVLVEVVKATFTVDPRRLYATGFSNGGGFVLSRLVIEMPAVFAAFATSGAALAGEAALDRLPTGLTTSVYSVLGTQDEKVSEGTGHPLPLPFVAEELAADSLFSEVFTTTTTILSLAPTYTAAYAPPAYDTLTFNTSLVGADNVFIFRMVNNLGHVYPSGGNNRHGLNVADDFWTFFEQHPLTAP